MSSEKEPAALAALEKDYEILRELGRGGTAIVYLARERETGEEVAIKLIRAKYIEDEEAVARFAREARFVAQLDHPNIVAVHRVLDLGAAGTALVMAHVPGRTLKQVIKEDGRLSPKRAEEILRGVAKALGAAHAMGIVHRDVKPENIFVDAKGHPLLADFGLARSMSNDTHLTMAGVAIGTPAYMAPEQIDGNDLDARGDIYSLGLVCWEMLTGHRPWEGESLYAVLYHQKHEQLPDVRDIRDDVPDYLASVIARAIEKNRDDRWQSTKEMLAALRKKTRDKDAPTHVRVSADTVRFTRPPTPPSAPTASSTSSPPRGLAPVLSDGERSAAFASVAAELAWQDAGHLPAPPPRPSRRRYALAGGALVGIAGLALAAATIPRGPDTHARSGRVLPPPRVTLSDTGASLPPIVSPAIARQEAADSAARKAVADSIVAKAAADSVAREAARQATAAFPVTPQSDAGRGKANVATKTAPQPSATTQAPAAQPSAPNKTGQAQSSAPVAAPVSAPPPLPAPSSASTAVAPSSRVTVAAGGVHTCLVAADGRAFCWGGNDRGQVGNGGTSRAGTAAIVSPDVRFNTIAAGLSHSCALARGSGAAWCWGENDQGQLGDRTTTAHPVAVRAAEGHSFRTITVGAAHTCALESDGDAFCWGGNTHGQLGAGELSPREMPSATPVSGGRRLTAITAGWNFTCALEQGGHAYCWGENSSGQLGSGSTMDRRTPEMVSADLLFSSIAAGSAHACGVTTQGDAYCWGQNSSGQLGDGTHVDHRTPVRVKTSAHFVSIAAGAVHTCALTADGDAYCWGRNTYGQLGDGTTTDQPQPVRVAGGHAFASLRSFGSHTCGSTLSGEAFCWGYNLDGQLGDGTRAHRTRPVYVEPPPGGG